MASGVLEENVASAVGVAAVELDARLARRHHQGGQHILPDGKLVPKACRQGGQQASMSAGGHTLGLLPRAGMAWTWRDGGRDAAGGQRAPRQASRHRAASTGHHTLHPTPWHSPDIATSRASWMAQAKLWAGKVGVPSALARGKGRRSYLSRRSRAESTFLVMATTTASASAQQPCRAVEGGSGQQGVSSRQRAGSGDGRAAGGRRQGGSRPGRS